MLLSILLALGVLTVQLYVHALPLTMWAGERTTRVGVNVREVDEDSTLNDDDQTNDNEGPTNGTTNRKPYAMAYYPGWIELSPEKVDFSLFDWIDFAFAIPTAEFGVDWGEDTESPKVLDQIITKAHAGKTKVKLSIGGWTGSKHFSKAVASEESRGTFVKALQEMYTKTKVDGVDIDWEYPGQEGDTSDFAPEDLNNYLEFLKALRQALGDEAKITAAVTPQPWVDETGNPAKNLTDFAKVLDWVLIMNYDVNVPPQEIPGPNAPLRDGCKDAERPEATAEGGLNAWKAAGFPANKIALGIAAYGYVHESDATKIKMRRDDGSTGTLKADDEGQIQFKTLIKQGALSSTQGAGNTTKFEGAGGFIRHWDKCSKTPFLTGQGKVVSYDDTRSIRRKGEFVLKNGMLGTGMWDIHGDTKEFDLTKAARRGMGLTEKEDETSEPTPENPPLPRGIRRTGPRRLSKW